MPKQITKIAVVICFIGKLPWYFNYFLQSCIFNPTIDFCIFTDDETFFKKEPENVKFHKISLDRFNKLASSKLGFIVNVSNPYKLNDFKPAYGLIFENYIKDFDFWAYADLDVIFGNIRNFLDEETLSEFDVICPRPDYAPGCFVLLKNSYKMNNLFKESKDYKNVLISNVHYCFDETNFSHFEFQSGLHYSLIKTEIESITHVFYRLKEENKLKVFFDLFIIDGIPGKMTWNKGCFIYRNKFEIMLYHLMRFKKNFKIVDRQENNFTQLKITPTRIIHIKI